MPRYRHALPQLSGSKVFLTDGGLETTLVILDSPPLESGLGAARFVVSLPPWAALLWPPTETAQPAPRQT